MGVRVESGLVRSSAVIGRDRELERLRAVVERARSGQSACLVLEGEGGIGKTRLLAEAATMARVEGVALVVARRPGESREGDDLVRSLRRDDLAEIIAVAPLDERAVGDLIGALLDANPPSPLVADVLAKTDGVPLLVEELV